ncbi:putative metalloprotease CJM1_0395 family protein [Rheinheimera sp. WS51]|uniref:putative metalloprotease CJM1_0395 family protein n=1 Tax=Rheinheimera sp. WS51 TaxID=3425886 RepID=UPI003D8D7AF8
MITSHYPNVSINTANPLTEQARVDNSRLDLFSPVKSTEKSAAEKPVTADDKSTSKGTDQRRSDATDNSADTYQAINPRSKQNSEQEAKQDQQAEAKQKQAEAAELKQVEKLKARDLEVKTHEQAHASVGGSYAAAPSYSYEQGPDGKRYAVGGEVQIDIAPVANDPKATVAKMQQVQAAALAPAQPSSADLAIAAKAAQQAQQARAELTAENASHAAADKGIQKRREVISGFYQQATSPHQQHSLTQTA